MTLRSQFDDKQPEAGRAGRLPAEPDDAFGRRLTDALEAAPSFTIPAGFAARTAAGALRGGPPVADRIARSGFGQITARSCFAALILALLLLASLARSRAVIPMTVEMLLVLEFVAVASWLSLRPDRDR